MINVFTNLSKKRKTHTHTQTERVMSNDKVLQNGRDLGYLFHGDTRNKQIKNWRAAYTHLEAAPSSS